MPFTTSVDPDFMGPTLRELLPVLGDLPEPIEVRWQGTPEDNRLYSRNLHRMFTFICPDVDVAEKALYTHGGSLTLDQADFDAARTALMSRNSGAWRSTAENLGQARATLLLTKVVGDAIRAGKKPQISTVATIDCLFGRVSPIDVDTLIRLRSSQG